MLNPWQVNQFDPSNPQGYDAANGGAMSQLAMALGQRLMQQQPQQGQMVSGWYVPPGRNSGIATTFANALGAYMQAQGMTKAEADRREQSKALAFALKQLREPTSEEKDLTQQFEENRDNPTIFTYKKPEDVGPQQFVDEPFNAAKDSQAASAALAQQPPKLPPQQVAVPTFNPAERVGTEKGRATSSGASISPGAALKQARSELANDPEAQALSVGAYNTRVQQRANEIVATGGYTKITPDAVERLRAVKTQGQPFNAAQDSQAAYAQLSTPSVQTPAVNATQAVTTTTPPSLVAPAYKLEDTFNIDKASQLKAAQSLAERLRTAQANRQDAAIQLMGNSGERGQKFADAIIAAQISGKGEGKLLEVKGADGVTRGFINERTKEFTEIPGGGAGESVAQQRLNFDIEKEKTERAGKLREERASLLSLRDATQTTLTNLNVLRAKVDNIPGMWNAVKGGVGKFLNIPNDATDARAALVSAKGSALQLGMQLTKTGAGTAAGLSEKESTAIQASVAALETSQSQDEIYRNIQNIYNLAEGAMKRSNGRLAELEGGASSAPQQTKSGVDLMPPRGTTLRP